MPAPPALAVNSLRLSIAVTNAAFVVSPPTSTVRIFAAESYEAAIRSGDQLYVPERSWSSRRIGLISAGLGTSVALLIALMNH